jgi:hypothetical protein
MVFLTDLLIKLNIGTSISPNYVEINRGVVDVYYVGKELFDTVYYVKDSGFSTTDVHGKTNKYLFVMDRFKYNSLHDYIISKHDLIGDKRITDYIIYFSNNSLFKSCSVTICDIKVYNKSNDTGLANFSFVLEERGEPVYSSFSSSDNLEFITNASPLYSNIKFSYDFIPSSSKTNNKFTSEDLDYIYNYLIKRFNDDYNILEG